MPNIWIWLMFNFDMQEGQLAIPLAIPYHGIPICSKIAPDHRPFPPAFLFRNEKGASSSLLVLSSFIPFLYSFNPCPVLFFPFPFPFLFLFSSFPLSYKTMGGDTAPKRYPFQEFSKDNEFESGMCIMLHGCFEGQGRCSMMFLVFFFDNVLFFFPQLRFFDLGRVSTRRRH